MIITIKPREDNQDRKTYYRIKCSKCGAEYVFSSDDILGQERRITGTKWIACPECGECTYWSINFVGPFIKTISKEEYDSLANKFAPKNEEEDNQ